jgi:hypothetical protein
VVVKAGYLVRTAQIQGETLLLTGDVNRTTIVELVSSPEKISSISFNGQKLDSQVQESTGLLTASVKYHSPSIRLPDISSLDWKYADSLPEIQSEYNDSRWTVAGNTYTNNTERNLTTPTSLYSSDYAYNGGSLLYRGDFTATGRETEFNITTQGGSAYGASVWLDNIFLGSWHGVGGQTYSTLNLTVPKLLAHSKHTYTVLIDHMGNEENGLILGDVVCIFTVYLNIPTLKDEKFI